LKKKIFQSQTKFDFERFISRQVEVLNYSCCDTFLFYQMEKKKLKIERSNTRIDKHAQTLLREKEFRRPNCGQRFYYRDRSVL